MKKNKHKHKKLNAGRSGIGKSVVVGVKDHETNQIVARVIPDTTVKTLQDFVEGHTEPTAQVYTDDVHGYVGPSKPHDSVSHSGRAYMRHMAHANGIESFWSMRKRRHKDTFQQFSKKHLDRYVIIFTGCQNARKVATEAQMRGVVSGMVGKILRYKDLIADNGLASEARR